MLLHSGNITELEDLSAIERGNDQLALRIAQERRDGGAMAKLGARNIFQKEEDAEVPMEVGGRLVLRKAAITRCHEQAPKLQGRNKVESVGNIPSAAMDDSTRLRCIGCRDQLGSKRGRRQAS